MHRTRSSPSTAHEGAHRRSELPRRCAVTAPAVRLSGRERQSRRESTHAAHRRPRPSAADVLRRCPDTGSVGPATRATGAPGRHLRVPGDITSLQMSVVTSRGTGPRHSQRADRGLPADLLQRSRAPDRSAPSRKKRPMITSPATQAFPLPRLCTSRFCTGRTICTSGIGLPHVGDHRTPRAASSAVSPPPHRAGAPTSAHCPGASASVSRRS
jgi:hypothetical protein